MDFLLADGIFLVAGVILGIAAILGILFYFMYHTFHGDLPKFMVIVVAIFAGIAAVLGVIGVVLLLN